MRKTVLIAAVAALAGCAQPGAPRPVEARLTATDLVVRMSDGTRCDAPWAAGQGRMERCGLDWRVIPDSRTNPLRYIFVDVFQTIGLGSVIVPMADVVLTGADGRAYGFAFPEPPRDR